MSCFFTIYYVVHVYASHYNRHTIDAMTFSWCFLHTKHANRVSYWSLGGGGGVEVSPQGASDSAVVSVAAHQGGIFCH